jgi:hypothetical protein
VLQSPATDLGEISRVSDDTKLPDANTLITPGTVFLKIDKKRDQGLVE